MPDETKPSLERVPKVADCHKSCRYRRFYLHFCMDGQKHPSCDAAAAHREKIKWAITPSRTYQTKS